MPDGRISALRMPVVNPTGEHGFMFPDPDARLSGGYDMDAHMVHQVGWFFRSGGTDLPIERCMGVVPSTVRPSCVEGLCAPFEGDEAATCESDDDCTAAYPLGVADPNDPAYAEPNPEDPEDIHNHTCAWLEAQ